MMLERAEYYAKGAKAADSILREIYQVDVEKTLNPLNSSDFLAIVERLSRSLRGVTRHAEADALRRAVEGLDVDWPNLSSDARNQVINASRQAIESVADEVIPSVTQVFSAGAGQMVRSSKKSAVLRFDLNISADLTRTDARVAKYVRESQANFVRDEYGKRSVAFSEKAREIVAAGLERGYGASEISGELYTVLSDSGLKRSRAYWDVIAMNFSNRARTTTQLASFEEAGVETYKFESILDSATSTICRSLHGRTFAVSKAMSNFRKLERARDPEKIKNIQPFVQSGVDEDGNQVLYYERDEERHIVAHVNDSNAEPSLKLSDEQLESSGISVPPLHGRCRSTIVAFS